MPTDPWNVKAIEAKAGGSLKAAREVLTKGGFGTVEPRADGMGWWVVCKGMTGTYEVSVRRGPRGGLESHCTCPSTKKPCKHALALLLYLAEHPEARPEAAAPAARSAMDFEALLRAAFANPEDDTPRLVLADYLEENDQPDRAALIRTQCAISRLPAQEAEKELIPREAQLLTVINASIGKLPKGYAGVFVRGFLRIKVTHYPEIKSANGLPARFVKLFRDGWVDVLAPQFIVPGLIPICRLVGELDLTTAVFAGDDLSRLVKELRPNDPETRVRRVNLPEAQEGLYRALLAREITS